MDFEVDSEPEEPDAEPDEESEIDEEVEADLEAEPDVSTTLPWVKPRTRPFIPTTSTPASTFFRATVVNTEKIRTDKPRIVIITSLSPAGVVKLPELSHLTPAERSAYNVVLNYLKSLSESARQQVLNDKEWHGWLKANHPTLSDLFTPESIKLAIDSINFKPRATTTSPVASATKAVLQNTLKVSTDKPVELRVGDSPIQVQGTVLDVLPKRKKEDFTVTSDELAKMRSSATSIAQQAGVQIVFQFIESDSPMLYDEIFTETQATQGDSHGVVNWMRTARNSTHLVVLLPREGTRIMSSVGALLTDEELKQLNGP